MYLGGAGLTEHPDQRTLGVAAHDRVVHHDQPLAGDHFAQRVQLEPDTQLADGLAGLDEGTPHVGVLDQALAVGDAGLLGVADGGRSTRLGHRDDQVRGDRVLAGQPAAHVQPGGVHRPAGDRGVRSGQVDVLEDAPGRSGVGEPERAQPVGVDGDHLAGFDLADEGCADDVQARRLAADHPATVQAAEHERVDAVGVAGRVERGLVHEHQAERTPQVPQHLQRGGLHGVVAGSPVSSAVISAVSVVLPRPSSPSRAPLWRSATSSRSTKVFTRLPLCARATVPEAGRTESGLGVLPGGAAGRGVATVTHRDLAVHRPQRRLVEHLGDQPDILVDQDLACRC